MLCSQLVSTALKGRKTSVIAMGCVHRFMASYVNIRDCDYVQTAVVLEILW